MTAPTRPAAVPGALPLGTALDHNAAWASLMARVQASRQRFAVMHSSLPTGLQAAVRPGPLDDAGFTLLADSSAAAAKLRQCLPALDQAAAAAGLPPLTLRVKVLPRTR